MWLLRVTLGEFDVFKERVKTDTISGDMPNVALFDANGRRIGFKNGEKHGKVKSGQGYDITVEPFESDNRKDPEYVTISASRSDAICIAAVTVTGADQDFSHEELLPQFKYKKETVCNSEPRQHFYKDINELQCPPVFKEFPKFDEETGYKNNTQVLLNGVTTCKPAIGEEVSDEDLSRLRKGIKNHSRIGSESWTYGVKRNQIFKRKDWKPLGCDLKNAVVVSKGYTARAICEHPTSAAPTMGTRRAVL
ncbi:hypothetical protein A7C99_6991 [Trichophyton rubrum]|uniref:Uncharacterized protein n=1 Tax=Trichophyton rubrum TaxID=5551 RepID=A0A178EQY9_TRIRU|nr:hypothetical protein A7C99_6991 [Trichophyton rubrum]